MKVCGTVGVLMALAANVVWAEAPAAETASSDGVDVAIYPWEFLTEEELATLRLVLVNKEALALFVPTDAKGGFAALAVSPEDGFIRDGVLVKSASAIAGMENRQAAVDAALEACNAARQGTSDCAIALDVGPTVSP